MPNSLDQAPIETIVWHIGITSIMQWSHLERNLYGHPLARLLWEKKIGRGFVARQHPAGSVITFTYELNSSHQKPSTTQTMAGRRSSLAPLWLSMLTKNDLEERTPLIDQVYLGCTQRASVKTKSVVFAKVTTISKETKSKIGEVEKRSRILELRHVGPSSNMRGMLLRIGAQPRGSIIKSFNTVFRMIISLRRATSNSWASWPKYLLRLHLKKAHTAHEPNDQTSHGRSVH